MELQPFQPLVDFLQPLNHVRFIQNWNELDTEGVGLLKSFSM